MANYGDVLSKRENYGDSKMQQLFLI